MGFLHIVFDKLFFLSFSVEPYFIYEICEHLRLPKLGLGYMCLSGLFFLVWVFMHLSGFHYFNIFCPWTIFAVLIEMQKPDCESRCG